MAATKIDLMRPWKEVAGTKRAGGNAVSYFEVGELKLDLRPEALFELIAPALREHYVKAVDSAKGQPTKGTIRRRGPGKLFSVTGEFKSGVAFQVVGKILTLTTGRLSKTVPRWLQFRVPGVRAASLLKAMRKEIEKAVREGLIKQEKGAA